MNREEFQTERTRIISEMLDNPDEYGIYPTTKCFEQLDALFDSLSLPPAEGAEQRIRVRNILQDFYRRGEYELEQAEEDIMRLFQPRPTAEGAEEYLKANLSEGEDMVISDRLRRRTKELLNGFATLHAQRIAEKMVSERDELQVLMNDISEWSDKAFGDGQRNPAIVYHLKKEVNELIEAIEKTNALGSDPSVGVGEFGRQLKNTRTEYADCMMLLLDSALHFGISAKELLSLTREKLEVNKARKWGSPDENGVVEHIE